MKKAITKKVVKEMTKTCSVPRDMYGLACSLSFAHHSIVSLFIVRPEARVIIAM